MPRTQAGPEHDVHLEAEQIIQDMRAAAADEDGHWFLALLEAVRRWPLPAETVGDRTYRYLVGGEAFDWLLLAERLLTELDGLVPEAEAEALLFHERLPIEATEGDFERLLGAKYKPHLNFVYGVRVEAALQVAVGEEVRKERTAAHIWENGRGDEETFRRIYGRERDDLLAEFSAETGVDPLWMTLADLSEWRYWLFQQRVRNCDPAKVASDTRKGLALLQRLEFAARRREDAPLEE
jgi:hypothetical protein